MAKILNKLENFLKAPMRYERKLFEEMDNSIRRGKRTSEGMIFYLTLGVILASSLVISSDTGCRKNYDTGGSVNPFVLRQFFD